VSVLLGKGDGTFQPKQTISVGSGSRWMAVADVNGDGKPHMVIASNSGGIKLLRGNGDGTFQVQQAFATGQGPGAVAVGDLNRDGKPDLVVANYGTLLQPGNTVSVLLGNGDGTFAPQQTFAVGFAPDSIAVADVNGDGRPDLVVGCQPFNEYGVNSVSVLLGNGDGTFAPPQTFPVGPTPFSVAVADINADGKPDILVPNVFYNTVSVVLGNGDGTFAPPKTYTVGKYPASVAVADVNGEGKPDLIVANDNGGSVPGGPCTGTGRGTPSLGPHHAGERALGQRRRHLPAQANLRGWRCHRHPIGVGGCQWRRQARSGHRREYSQRGKRAAGQRRRHLRGPANRPRRQWLVRGGCGRHQRRRQTRPGHLRLPE
jgi:hypothetical protein